VAVKHAIGPIVCVAAIAAAGIRPAKAIDVPWTLGTAMVKKVETEIVMPKGAGPLSAYTRYYEAGFDHGRRIVFGELLLGGDRRIHLSDHPPLVIDGGCWVV